jgi:NitT/TauT family transport system ATP-binding protein
VELVVNAQGVSAAIQHYRGYKAHLVLCANSLAAQNLDAPEGVRVVPNAMLYLAEQQAGGWAYIRA